MGLVVTADEAATPMQGYRNEPIHLTQFRVAGNGRGEQCAEKIIQMTVTAKLEGENKLTQDAVVYTYPDEVGNVRAAVPASVTAVVDKGVRADIMATDTAIGGMDFLIELTPAVGA